VRALPSVTALTAPPGGRSAPAGHRGDLPRGRDARTAPRWSCRCAVRCGAVGSGKVTDDGTGDPL